MSLSGIVNLNKPWGMTSRRAVDHVQRLVRPAKAGHAGTLDPLASGVLVVCVGQATRLIEYVQRMRKRYRGAFLLGRWSDTEDVTGRVVELDQPPIPARAAVDAAARSLVGRLMQRPPAFSALKVGGRRAYDLARAGQAVELAPREVTIDRLEVVDYAYPELTLDVECSGGTYVRSLGRDLAIALGTQAVMSSLVRGAIGDFRLDGALAPDSLTRENIAASLLPPRAAVPDLPAISLDEDELHTIGRGMPVAVSPERVTMALQATSNAAAEEWAAIDASGRLAAILKPLGEGRFTPTKNLAVD